MSQKKSMQTSYKARKKKGSKGWIFFSILLFLFLLAMYFLFPLKTVTIQGNHYVTQEDISGWLQNSFLRRNTLYVYLRYNGSSPKQLPLVERMDMTWKTPDTLEIQITEKDIAYTVAQEDTYFYMDEENHLLYTAEIAPEGVVLLEGMEVDIQNAKVGKELSTAYAERLEQAQKIRLSLDWLGLQADTISYADGNFTVSFGVIRVDMGSENYETKCEAIPALLENVQAAYPDTGGTFHLESYTGEEKNIRFVPD